MRWLDDFLDMLARKKTSYDYVLRLDNEFYRSSQKDWHMTNDYNSKPIKVREKRLYQLLEVDSSQNLGKLILKIAGFLLCFSTKRPGLARFFVTSLLNEGGLQKLEKNDRDYLTTFILGVASLPGCDYEAPIEMHVQWEDINLDRVNPSLREMFIVKHGPDE